MSAITEAIKRMENMLAQLSMTSEGWWGIKNCIKILKEEAEKENKEKESSYSSDDCCSDTGTHIETAAPNCSDD